MDGAEVGAWLEYKLTPELNESANVQPKHLLWLVSSLFIIKCQCDPKLLSIGDPGLRKWPIPIERTILMNIITRAEN